MSDILNDDLTEIDNLFGYKPQPKPAQSPKDVSDLLDRMRGGVFQQESGGNYQVKPNTRTGATGGFQVMPDNIPSWTEKHYGRRLTRDEFERNSKAQEAVFTGEMGKYLQKAREKAPDDDTALRMAAAAWYGGEKAMNRYDDPKRFRPDEPSFREYTTSVLKRSGKPSPPVDLSATDQLFDSGATEDLTDIDNLFGYNPQAETVPMDQKGLMSPADVGRQPVSPTIPSQMPSNLAGSTAQATPPMPERPETLEMQRMAAHDPVSTRAAVLYTPGSPLTPIAKGEVDVPLKDGSILRANIEKFNQFLQANGPTAYNDLKAGNLDFSSLIGGKAQPTNDTANKTAVITRDQNGIELVASSVETPDAIETEAAMQKAQFPNIPTTTEVVHSNDVVNGRVPLDNQEQRQQVMYKAGLGKDPTEVLLDQQAPTQAKTPQNPTNRENVGQSDQRQYTTGEPRVLDDEQPVADQRKIGAIENDDQAVAETIQVGKGTPQQQAREALTQLSAKYGFDPEAVLAANKDLKITRNGEAGNVDVTYGDIRRFTGNSTDYDQERAEQRTEQPRLDLSLRRPQRIPDEREAEQALEKRIKETSYSIQQKALEHFSDPINLTPLGVFNAPSMFNDPSDEWVQQEKKRLLAENDNSYSKAYDAEKDYQEMSAPEFTARMVGQTARSFTKNLVGGTAKTLIVASQMLEDSYLNPVNKLLPDDAKIGLRNVGNYADFVTRLVSSRDSATALKEMKWAKGTDDIDKQQAFQAAQEFDKAIGDDPILKKRFFGGLADATGSALAFIALGAAMPSMRLGSFAMGRAALRKGLGETAAKVAMKAGALPLESGISGGMQALGTGYEEGKGQGLSEADAKTYGVMQGLIGTSEMIGAGGELVDLIKNPAMRGRIANALLEVGKATAKEAKEEFAQEVFQTSSGQAVLEYLKDNDPSTLSKLTTALNKLPKQIAKAASNEGIIALATGGMMGGAGKAGQIIADGKQDVAENATTPMVDAGRVSFDENQKETLPEVNQEPAEATLTPESKPNSNEIEGIKPDAGLQSNKNPEQASAVEPISSPETGLQSNKPEPKRLTVKDAVEPGTPVTVDGRGEAVIVQDNGKNVVIDHTPKPGKNGETTYSGRATVRKDKVTLASQETVESETQQPETPTDETQTEVQPLKPQVESKPLVQDQAPDVPPSSEQVTKPAGKTDSPTATAAEEPQVIATESGRKTASQSEEVAPEPKRPFGKVQSIQLAPRSGASIEDNPIIAKEGKFSGSLEIPRAEMPQISGDDFTEFKDFAKEKGVEIKPEQVQAKTLKPTQRSYNPEHSASLPEDALDKPLTVSSDNRVLDGHNRLVRLLENGERTVTINRLPLTAEKALSLMKEFPKTTYKLLNQVGNGKPENTEIPASNEVAKPEPPKVRPMASFMADDDVAKAVKSLGTDDETKALDIIKAAGTQYGLSEKEVEGVVNRAREKKQRSDNERKTQDIIVREPRRPKGQVVEGSSTKILTPETGKSYDAKYVVREASDVFSSHNPVTFQPNAEYDFVNDRHYDKEEQYQKQVIDRSRNFKTQYFITDSPTAADGPPVIDSEGNVLGGNSRSMILRRIYQLGEVGNTQAEIEYKTALKEKAAQFGYSPDAIDEFNEPVLVREISDELINKQHAITELNETSTTELTTKEQAVADAGKLSDDAVDHITAKIEVTGNDASLGDALNQHGVSLVNYLIDEKIFSPGERNTLLDDGKITEDGKRRIERLLLGKVFSDLGQMENASPSTRNTIVRIISPLMKVNADPEWNILPDVQEGIELLNEAKASGQGDHIDTFANNRNFLRPQGWSPQAVGIAKTLNSGLRKTTQQFKQYAEDMRLAKYGSGAMFDMGAKTQAEAYGDAFGVVPGEKASVPQTTPEVKDVEKNVQSTVKEDHAKFFKSQDKLVPLDKLIEPTGMKPTDAEPSRAMGYMRDMADGKPSSKGPRDPISVKENGDGTYTIVDGKATYTAAKEFGWKTLPVQVLSNEGKAAELETMKERHKVLLEELRAKRTNKPKVVKLEEPTLKSGVRNDQTETPEFKKWFKDSKVVDENGDPLRVFHGTTANFEAFDTNRDIQKAANPSWSGALGSWFAAPSKYKGNYDEGNAEYVADSFTENPKGRIGGPDEFMPGANVIPSYLSIQNPMEYEGFEDFQDARGYGTREISQKAFKQKLIDAGYDGIVIRNSETDGNVDRDDWVAFYPEQIKSAIGNNGEFDPNNPSILKSGLSRKLDESDVLESERMTVEEMKDLTYLPFDDLIDGRAKVDIVNGNISANATSHEIYRRALEYIRVKAGRTRIGSKQTEDLFTGVFMRPNEVRDIISGLEEKRTEAKDLGYSPEEVAVFTDHIKALEESAKAGDGTAIIYVVDRALPHEMFHRADYMGAMDKALMQRHSKASAKALDEHRVTSILAAKHFAKFNQFSQLSDSMRRAWIRSEIPPHLLELSEDQLRDQYGITPEMAADYMLTWFEGYVEKNGIEALDNFDKEEINVQTFLKQVKDEFDTGTTADTIANENVRDGSRDEVDPPVERKPSRETKSDTASDGESSTVSLNPGEKLRRLPKTMRAAGLDAIDMAYEVYGDKAATDEATRLLNDYGIEGSIKLLRDLPAASQDAQHAILSFMLIRTLQDHANEIRATDPATALKNYELSLKLAREHAVKATGAGRFTRMPSVIGPTIEHLTYAVQGVIEDKYGEGKTLNDKEREKWESLGRELEAAHAKMTGLQKDLRNHKAKIKRLEDAKEGKKPKRRSSSSQKSRAKLVQLVKDEKQSTVDALRAKLRARFNAEPVQMSALSIDPSLKSAVEEDFPIDDFAEVGAMMLTDGLAGPDDYLPHDFEADMVAEFGDVVKPYFTEIYKQAWAKRNEWLDEIRYQQTKERIEAKYNDGNELEDWEIDEILGEQKAKAKRRRAIEAYHRMAAGGKPVNKQLADLKRIISELAPDTDTAIGAALQAERLGADEMYARMKEMGITDGKAQREAIRNGKEILDQARIELQAEKDAIANELLEAEKDLKTIGDLRWQARNEMNKAQRSVNDEMRRIKTGEFWYRTGQVIDITNSMRTMMASFDMSGALRQGGFFAFAKPELQRDAFVNMFKTWTSEQRYGRVIMEIEANPLFTLAQRSGIDFAMAGKGEDSSLMGEELYRGESTIEKLPLLGKPISEIIVKPSERTYTSFLDTQRMSVFEGLAKNLLDAGMTFEKNRPQFEQIGKFINVATGRGTVPQNMFGKLIMNMPLFAPRYTLSRFQLINMTLNPVAYYHMPAGTRAIVAKNAARFYGTTMGTLGLIALFGSALGLSVNFDDDDDDFLKITHGNTKYDIFAGALPVEKMLIKLIHSAYRTSLGTNNRVEKEFGLDIWNAGLRFGRGKLSPLGSLVVDTIAEKDYNGNKTELTTTLGGVPVPGKAIYSRLIPLTIGDAVEAYKLDGGVGVAKSVTPLWFGVGVSTYKPKLERPETEAEKLAVKASYWHINGESKKTREQRELKNELVARSRRGEDVTAQVQKGIDEGYFNDFNKKEIFDAAKKTLLVDKVEGLRVEYVLAVYQAGTPAEKEALLPILQGKVNRAKHDLAPGVMKQLEDLGIAKEAKKAKKR